MLQSSLPERDKMVRAYQTRDSHYEGGELAARAGR